MRIDYVELFQVVAKDVNLDPFTTMYCKTRLKNEGLQYWTVTLPKLSSAVLRSLELGYFDRSTITCFAWKGRSLRYFRSFLGRIFDTKTGLVLDEVDPVAIWQIRQLCEYTYKLALPFDTESLSKYELEFKTTDESLSSDTDVVFVEQLRKDAEHHYSGIAKIHAHEVYSYANPRPGPGTFSGLSRSYTKRDGPWYLRKVVDYRYNPAFKAYSGYFKPYPGAPIQGVCNTDPFYSEVLFVPKDSRGPRVIVREPYTVLSSQMSFNTWLTDVLEKETSYRVNFKSQQVNQNLAESASIKKHFATLDLKSASDRVSFDIVNRIFRNFYAFRHFLSMRTKQALLPVSGEMVSLNKLSGMGSGLTFPVMSFLIKLAITRQVSDDKRLPYATVNKDIYVYGDDIILPTDWTESAIKGLSRVKLVVNSEKSFKHSHFRESCGGDYYNGNNVAPTRLKLQGANPLVADGSISFSARSFAHAINEISAHCEQLMKNAMLTTADYLYNIIESRIGKLPLIGFGVGIVGRVTHQRIEYQPDVCGTYRFRKVPVVVTEQIGVDADPYIALGQFFQRSKEDTCPLAIDDERRGQRYGAVNIPRSAKLKRIRVSEYALFGSKAPSY